jgi:serine/threonine protein phosphatase PrpC
MIPLKTEWHAVTDVGVVRRVNEDRYLASDALGMWAVADGMGGMARGDWAAGMIIEVLSALSYQEDLRRAIDEATAALHQANARILHESSVVGEQMGSTIVLVAVRERQFAVMWVGDSRAYLIRDRRLYPLTRDHSQVQELVDRGVLDAEGAAKHPLRNVLTRAVGVGAQLEPDLAGGMLESDDLLLLCSDGLYGVLGEAEIQTILDREPIEQAGRTMISRCHALGAPDNITLVTLSLSESTLVQFEAIGSGTAK